jgi:trimethylamine--corrinoid protein Co-methyltransferase
MTLIGLQGGQYQPLSAQQVETVHNAALTILEKTGNRNISGENDELNGITGRTVSAAF